MTRLGWTSLVADTESTAPSYTHYEGLKPDPVKYYRVFALNSAGSPARGPRDPVVDDAIHRPSHRGPATMPEPPGQAP